MRFLRLTPLRSALLTLLYLGVWWRAWAWATAQNPSAAETVRQWGLVGLFALGMGWLVWILERTTQRIEARRLLEQPLLDRRVLVAGEAVQLPSVEVRTWNPLDPAAWYYGRNSQRLKQSLAALTLYSVAFLLIHLFLGNLNKAAGNNSVPPYELPSGGGQDSMPRTVRIQKVITPKFVINPYSAILINVPPIDQINLKIMDDTKGMYVVGQGGGDGAGSGGIGQGTGSGSGFGAGTGSGQVRFIRLKHSDRHWDKNFGIGGDMNMLSEYHSRTRHKVAETTEYIDVSQLATFPPRKSPPLVYVSGSQTFSLSQSEKRILRQYLLERHGMVFGDNQGGQAFHNSFIATMNEVTGVNAVPIPRDDYIHRRPYLVPALPIVVAHGGTVPLGWNVDGRWVGYYHPGAISDAWRDDHAGIKREVYEECYQLGVNIIFYAHAEYSKWLLSQKR